VAANSDVELAGATLQGLTGVNNGNINADSHSLQQSNVSIAVVSTRAH
jgi:hypothetical protein